MPTSFGVQWSSKGQVGVRKAMSSSLLAPLLSSSSSFSLHHWVCDSIYPSDVKQVDWTRYLLTQWKGDVDWHDVDSFLPFHLALVAVILLSFQIQFHSHFHSHSRCCQILPEYHSFRHNPWHKPLQAPTWRSIRVYEAVVHQLRLQRHPLHHHPHQLLLLPPARLPPPSPPPVASPMSSMLILHPSSLIHSCVILPLPMISISSLFEVVVWRSIV